MGAHTHTHARTCARAPHAAQEKKEKAAQEGVTLAATDAAANTFALGAAEKDLKDAVEGKKTAEMDAAANTFAKK